MQHVFWSLPILPSGGLGRGRRVELMNSDSAVGWNGFKEPRVFMLKLPFFMWYPIVPSWISTINTWCNIKKPQRKILTTKKCNPKYYQIQWIINPGWVTIQILPSLQWGAEFQGRNTTNRHEQLQSYTVSCWIYFPDWLQHQKLNRDKRCLSSASHQGWCQVF